MENSKLLKVVLIILIGAMVFTMGTSVLAADSSNDTYQDLADALNGTTSNNTTNNATNNAANNATRNTTRNTTGNNTLNTSSFRNNSNTLNTAYNNTTLPKAGITNSIPVVALIVIFGISAVYAYIKIKDYKNL